MNKITIRANSSKSLTLYCPFTDEKLYNEDNSFEIYEGAGNYLFSACEDCLFFDAGNNKEIEGYWNDSMLKAIETFTRKHSEDNILVIELQDENEFYYYGFANEENLQLSDEEIEQRFIK